MKVCPYCDNKVEDGLTYCPNCGATLEKTTIVAQNVSYAEQAVVQEQIKPSNNSNNSTKNIIIAVLATVVVLGAIVMLMNKDSASDTMANSHSSYETQQHEARQQENTTSEASPSEPDGVRCQINGTHVNMREYPNMKAQVIFQFPGYETVYATEKTEAEDGKYPWYKISYNGYQGWVYGQFVR